MSTSCAFQSVGALRSERSVPIKLSFKAHLYDNHFGHGTPKFWQAANSFGHGPLDLHGKICSCFFNVDFWNGTPGTRTALLKFMCPCAYLTAFHI